MASQKMSFSPMNIALDRYLRLPNRDEPNEFAKYLTVWLGEKQMPVRLELSPPFRNTWNNLMRNSCIQGVEDKFIVWCREIGIVDIESPVCEIIDGITSLNVWLMRFPSIYHFPDKVTKHVFSFLSEFLQLIILCNVSKRWARLARCDDVFGLATARMLWTWSGIDSCGQTEEDLWRQLRQHLGLSIFSLTR
jgi:hypothetical protein